MGKTKELLEDFYYDEDFIESLKEYMIKEEIERSYIEDSEILEDENRNK